MNSVRPLATEPEQAKNEIKNKEILLDWLQNSSAHGIPRLVKKYHLLIKLIWFICLMASYSYCFYLIITTLINFFDYSTQANSEWIKLNSIEFPAIDICSLSPFDYYKSGKYIQELIEKKNINFKSMKTKKERDDLINNLTREIYILFKNNSNVSEITNFNNLSVSYLRKDLLPLILNGFELSQALNGCKFNNEPCKVNDFYLYHNFYYGNCYRFNGGVNYSSDKIDILSSKRAGWSFGLEIELKRIRTILSLKYGFRVLINSQKQNFYAYPEEMGLTVSPGQASFISISKTQIENLPYPYSDCMGSLNDSRYKYLIEKSEILSDMLNIFKLESYNKKVCLKLCNQKIILKECGCVDIDTNVYLNYSSNICYKNVDLNCLNKYEKNGSSEYCHQMCPDNCELTKFDYQISTSKYPSEWFLNTFFDNLFNETNDDYGDLDAEFERDIDEYFSYKDGNTVLLKIFFDELSYTKIYRRPTIMADSLLGNLGGQLGLFMGISLISLVEFIELFVLFVLHLLKKTESIKTTNKPLNRFELSPEQIDALSGKQQQLNNMVA